MRKTRNSLGIIVIAVILGFGFIACGGGDDDNTVGTHEHSWSATWSSSATQHWKECTVADCDVKTQTANHVPSNGICTTCLYDNMPPHMHTYVYTVTSTTYPAQSIPTCSGCGDTGTARNTIIGDTGPTGGIIFYVASSGFTVQGYTGTPGTFAEYTAYYLEAAPANEGSSIQWGAYGTLIVDVTTFTSSSDSKASLIGNGRKDTQIILNHLSTTEETGRAAQVCASKTVKVVGTIFNDWFLPSLGELNAMYKAKTHFGISSGYFWSSSQYKDSSAWVQGFDYDYGLQGSSGKYGCFYVRAIRAF